MKIILSPLAINEFIVSFLGDFTDIITRDWIQLITVFLLTIALYRLTQTLKNSKRQLQELSHQHLREDTDRLRNALNAAQMGVWSWDLVTGKITWSPEHEQLFGLTPGTFDGQYETFDACLYPDDRAELNRTVAESLRNRTPYHHEFRVIWPDGSIHQIEGRGHAFYNQTGQPVQMMGTVVAIDERQPAQLLLQQQYEQQRLLLEIAQRIQRSLNLQEILQTTVDEVRKFLKVDRTIIFQFTPTWGGKVVVESVIDEALAILPLDIYDPCIGEQYLEPFKQGLVTAKSDIFQAAISPCHVQLLARFQVRANLVVPLLKGNDLWGLLVAHHCETVRLWSDVEIDFLRQIASQVSIALQQSDLFEQLQNLNAQLEERIVQRTAELTEVNNRLRISLQEQEQARQQLEEQAQLLDLAHDPIMTWDLNAIITFWNHGAELTYGWLKSEALGQELHTLLKTQFPKPLREIQAELLENGYWEGELLHFTWDNHPIPVSSRLVVQQDEAGIPIKVLEINNDISDRKRTEEELQQYERIISTTQDGIALLNRRYIYQIANPSYLLYCNRSQEEVIGESARKILGNDVFYSFIKERLDRCFAGEIIQYEQWFNYSQMAPQFFSITYMPFRDRDGNISGVIVSWRDLTRLKKAEQMLDLQAVITRNMAEGVCLVRADNTVIVYANPKFEQMFGYQAGELNGQHISIVNYVSSLGKSKEINQAICQAVLQHGEYTYEVHNVKKDGTPFWCRATCSVFNHPDYGDVFVAVHQDITDRKQAELALQQQVQQEQLLWCITQAIRQSLNLQVILNTTVTEIREILEVDRVAVYRFNPDWSGHFIVESVIQDWVKLIEDDVKRIWEDTYLQETQGGRFQNNDTLVVKDIYRANLQACHIGLLERFQAKSYVISPIFSGDSLWGLLAIYQNSHPRHWQSWEVELLKQIASQLSIAIQQSELYRQLQIELQERQQAEINLEKELLWTKTLFQTSLDGIAICNRQGDLVDASPSFVQMLGYTLEEALALNVVDWDAQWTGEELKYLLENNRLPPRFETRHRRKDGSIYDTEISYSRVKINGEMMYFCLCRDISDRKQKELALQQAMEAAEAANLAKSLFLANMSHELRTPLNVILGFAQVMSHDPYLTPSQQEDLETIRRSGDHLLSLINDVLDLSKIESGHCTVEQSDFDFIALLHSLRTMFTERTRSKGIELGFKIRPEVPQFIQADAQKLRQVLLNLLSNAIKFTDRGRITLEVSCEKLTTEVIVPTPYLLQVAVTDTGVGIALEEMQTIFDAFVQAQTGKRSASGTGLGLTISRKLLQLMGGEIAVSSILGQGSTFTFTLPVVSVSSAHLTQEPDDRLAIGLVPGQPQYRILAVDDCLENRRLIVRLLTQLGLEVREASNGQEAIQVWREWQPDLTWMDIQMPILDGYQATQQIRAMEQDRNSIIIALTAQASQSDRALALAVGCNDYISKPFREQTLLLKMAQYLGLEYCYADPPSSPNPPVSPSPEVGLDPLTLTLLSNLPEEWRCALEDAAVCGNDGAIATLVHRLPPEYAPLATSLNEFAEKYEFEQILQLLQTQCPT